MPGESGALRGFCAFGEVATCVGVFSFFLRLSTGTPLRTITTSTGRSRGCRSLRLASGSSTCASGMDRSLMFTSRSVRLPFMDRFSVSRAINWSSTTMGRFLVLPLPSRTNSPLLPWRFAVAVSSSVPLPDFALSCLRSILSCDAFSASWMSWYSPEPISPSRPSFHCRSPLKVGAPTGAARFASAWMRPPSERTYGEMPERNVGSKRRARSDSSTGARSAFFAGPCADWNAGRDRSRVMVPPSSSDPPPAR